MKKNFVLIYGDAHLPYQVQEDTTRSTRIAIHVEPDGTVLVEAPPGFSDQAVQKAVQRRARWITGHVAHALERFAHVQPREYVSGEQVLYLGRRYILKVIRTARPAKSAKLRGDRLEIESVSGCPDDIRGRLRGWYRVRAREYFAQRLNQLSTRMSWVPVAQQFRLLSMRRQWGSCSPSGQILLNPLLVKTPRACIDYVIVHELAHLMYHNHGREFLSLLDREIPRWNKIKLQLDGMVEIVMNE